MSKYEYNWSDLAFGSKKPLKDLNATFFSISREMSASRFKQLVKEYLPQRNLVVAIANEEYIKGFENQPQFKTLQLNDIQSVVDKVNSSASPHKITVLRCNQSDIVPILKKIKFRFALFINGSWLHSFHMRPEYYALVSNSISFKLVSPFVDEAEAKAYAVKFQPKISLRSVPLSEIEIMKLTNEVAKKSFANEHQTGVVIANRIGSRYQPMMYAHNTTVPFETFAWHNGASRERHLSPMGDLNNYDTNHAEVTALIKAQKEKIDLVGTSLFINLLPCPTCARMLCETDIAEIVYSLDHSDGYAVSLLEKAGKAVRRLIVENDIIAKEG